MNQPRPVRPGVASLALLMIVMISAAWWALALWPAGAVEPAWLARTRAACFGSAPGGLPDAGGWILLIGEPIGMIGVLIAVWGGALRDDLRRINAVPRWRAIAAAMVVASAAGLVALGRRTAHAAGLGTAQTAPAGTPTRINADVPGIVLTDQHGQRVSLAGFSGRPWLLTFAFGHCTTVCPAIVRDIRLARTEANRGEVPLVIISIDPWRDTPGQLPGLAAAWKLGPADRVLSGSVAEVEEALDRLGIGRRRDRNTGDVDHTGTVMGLDHRGRIVWRLDGGWGRVRGLLADL